MSTQRQEASNVYMSELKTKDHLVAVFVKLDDYIFLIRKFEFTEALLCRWINPDSIYEVPREPKFSKPNQ